jgi:hypothetical protein
MERVVADTCVVIDFCGRTDNLRLQFGRCSTLPAASHRQR